MLNQLYLAKDGYPPYDDVLNGLRTAQKLQEHLNILGGWTGYVLHCSVIQPELLGKLAAGDRALLAPVGA